MSTLGLSWAAGTCLITTCNAAVQQANGSILLATDAAGADALETRAAALHAQGIAAELLSAQQTMRTEPAVVLPACGGGLLVPSDAQLVSR
jgi:glycine/D-amino acid oxidase-like deaminating enzyme